MSCTNCNCKAGCTSYAIALSLTVGIVTAILRFMAVITLTPAFLWVLFGIAAGYLLLTPIISTVIRSSGVRECVCSVFPILLIALIGTVLTSLLLLAVEFAATSLLGAIITGLLLAFFTLIIASNACLAKCIVRCAGYDNG